MPIIILKHKKLTQSHPFSISFILAFSTISKFLHSSSKKLMYVKMFNFVQNIS